MARSLPEFNCLIRLHQQIIPCCVARWHRIQNCYFYYLLSTDFLITMVATHTGATSYPAVRDQATILANNAIPLAPLPEQHRIVAKIEEQFTRLDAGVAALKRAQANLKRYKAAVLKAACEGRLVAQDPSDEPASELLKRILAERRAKWEADLRAKGKDPKKAKYEEPQAPDIDELPELPSGWCWATVDTIFSMVDMTVITRCSEYVDRRDTCCYGRECIDWHDIDFDNARWISSTEIISKLCHELSSSRR